MTTKQHWAVFITNTSNTSGFIETLLNSRVPAGFEKLRELQGALFSRLELDRFIEEEVRHDRKLLTQETVQSLQSMSSGERKKALLKYLLASKPDYLILDNPFDNLDTDSQADLKHTLNEVSADTSIIQIISRAYDLLPFINTFSRLENELLLFYDSLEEVEMQQQKAPFQNAIPGPLEQIPFEADHLIQLKNVSVSYAGKPILTNINWDIKPGEFWQLAGKNGSGKTTILSMITGDNPKAYGQELMLFGTRKGSGESVWELKKNIGYFTPAMVDRFRGYHSLENMLISGLLDSIGLYVLPTAAQLRVAGKWLELVGMKDLKDSYFHDLSMGQQRLLMCVRAMIKHPLLLILDEPTAGLDDNSAALVVALVNKMAAESTTTIIFVSHRDEPGLEPHFVYTLEMAAEGSTGRVM